MSRVRRTLLLGSVAVFALGALPATATAGNGGGHEKTARQYAVGEVTETFVDSTRPTDANGTYAGAPDRTLPVLVLYPAKGTPGGEPVEDAAPARKEAPYPLVVFSHGFTATGPVYESRLLRGIAAAGYVVAAPTYPLSSRDAPGGPKITDYANQPGDVSFVIDEMLRLNRRDPELRGMIDPKRIGAAGHSLGAITTLGVTYNSCCVDDRIDAAVPMSGLQLPFRDQPWAWPDVPLLLIHGDEDELVPYEGSTETYADASAPKHLLTLLGAPHTPFFGEWKPVIVAATVDFLDRYLEGRRAALGRLTKDANIDGVATLQSTLR